MRREVGLRMLQGERHALPAIILPASPPHEKRIGQLLERAANSPLNACAWYAHGLRRLATQLAPACLPPLQALSLVSLSLSLSLSLDGTSWWWKLLLRLSPLVMAPLLQQATDEEPPPAAGGRLRRAVWWWRVCETQNCLGAEDLTPPCLRACNALSPAVAATAFAPPRSSRGDAGGLAGSGRSCFATSLQLLIDRSA